MKLELEKSREQQQASAANGSYHGEANMHSSAPLPAQHGLEYSLADAVPPTAIMRLQAAEEMGEPIEDEEEEEEDEDEEEDDEDEEDDASSLCSGLTDSSTQSLAASDSEEEDDEEDKSDSFEDASITSPGSHGEAVPLSSVLCYSDGAIVQDSHTNGNCYFSSAPPEYYQLENASTASINATANPTSESYGEVSPFQDGVANSNVNFNAASEQYPDYNGQPEEPYVSHFGLANGTSTVIVRSPDLEDNVRPGGVYREQPGAPAQVEFQNYLNNNSQERYVSNGNCFVAEKVKEVASGMNEVPPLPDSRQNPAILENFPQVAPV